MRLSARVVCSPYREPSCWSFDLLFAAFPFREFVKTQDCISCLTTKIDNRHLVDLIRPYLFFYARLIESSQCPTKHNRLRATRMTTY